MYNVLEANDSEYIPEEDDDETEEKKKEAEEEEEEEGEEFDLGLLIHKNQNFLTHKQLLELLQDTMIDY